MSRTSRTSSSSAWTVPHDGKADAIEKILNETGFDRCMAFCNTKGSTERITKFLQMRGIDAECTTAIFPSGSGSR